MIVTQDRNRRAVAIWLLIVAALVLVMVVVGGATRLTESGLSIVDWRPVTGVLPPIGLEEWQEEFAKYQESPEYQLKNRGMSLDAFKGIFYWEWGHRLLGRAIGLAFLLPFLWFLTRRRIPQGYHIPLLLLFLAGGTQGLLGWYMVQSGLIDEPAVSHYRLTAHLSLALLIFAGLLWTSFKLLIRSSIKAPTRVIQLARVAIILAYVQMVLGGLVAGLKAGHVLADWPWMGGQFVPNGLFLMEPAWRNFVDNAVTVQFVHRMVAYLLAILCICLALLGWRYMRTLSVFWVGLVILIFAQISLGVMTLYSDVAVTWGAAHQGGGVLVFAALIFANYATVRTAKSDL